jgi:hypothetical protein
MWKFLRKTALWIVLTPLAITYLGAGLNQLVLNANHDKFPVEVNTVKEKIFVAKATAEWKDEAAELGIDGTLPAGMIDDTHCIMTKDTHLNWLADVFDLRGDGIYSIGDGLITIGVWLQGFMWYVWVFEVSRRALTVKE